MNRIINLNKPAGITSHDAVHQVRRLTRERRVGHGGTLDPQATGVLLVAVGHVTRLLDYLGDLSKEYEGTLALGTATDTLDADGQIVARREVPPLTVGEIGLAMRHFTGTLLQRPPAFSAVKVGGVRAYQLAREGKSPELAAKEITVKRFELLAWEPPLLRFRVLVSRGTYVRSLAADLAEAMGTLGHLAALTRTAVGAHTLARSVSLEALAEAMQAGRFEAVSLAPAEALAHLPRLLLDDEGVRMLGNGLPPTGHFTLDAEIPRGKACLALAADGRLVGILRSPVAISPGGERTALLEIEKVLSL